MMGSPDRGWDPLNGLYCMLQCRNVFMWHTLWFVRMNGIALWSNQTPFFTLMISQRDSCSRSGPHFRWRALTNTHFIRWSGGFKTEKNGHHHCGPDCDPNYKLVITGLPSSNSEMRQFTSRTSPKDPLCRFERAMLKIRGFIKWNSFLEIANQEELRNENKKSLKLRNRKQEKSWSSRWNSYTRRWSNGANSKFSDWTQRALAAVRHF